MISGKDFFRHLRKLERHLAKDEMRKRTFSILSLLMLCILNMQSVSHAHQTSGDHSSFSDTTTINPEQTDDSTPWHTSVYIAAGTGTPQGLRYELGYNFGTIFSFGVSVGYHDSWSNHPERGTGAILGSFRIPIRSSPITPYILLLQEVHSASSAGNDEYYLLYFGGIVPLKSWLQLRPELGFDFTSKHISGGTDLFGLDTPEVREDQTRFGFNISLELDFARLLNR